MQRAERAAVLPCRPVPAPLPFPSPASRPGGSACMLHGGRSERRFLPRKAGSAATRLPGSAGRRTRRIMKQAFFPPPSGHGGGYGCTLRKISFEITRFQNTRETRAEDPAAQSAGLLRRVCREVSRLPRGAFPGTGSRALSHTGAFPGACLTGRQFSSFFRRLPGRGSFMADELRRLYLEPTSRCNLNCAMCFRKSWVDEEAGDMDEATFRAVLAHLPPGVETLFFGGMGEPLFHPHITDMVRAASAAGLRTELVSNGSLLTEERSAALLDAGLDMLWLSVDSLEEADYAAIRCNGSLAVLKKHILAFNQLRFRLEREVRLGVAFVLMKSNVRSLADLPFFASYYHVNEVNVSHLIPTSESAAHEVLYHNVLQSDFGGDHVPPAAPRIHLPLMDWTRPGVPEAVASLLSAGMCEIFLSGSRLRRPARRCRFVEEGMAFVRHDGMLSPCMALLRSSRLYWEGKTRLNQHLFFGNVRSQPLDRLWRSPEYAAFRQNVRAFEFSPCCRCSQCDNWELSLPDCYGNPAPSCGACLWSEGIISCP